MASAQTGTGKTAAFALPILHRLRAGSRGGAGDSGVTQRVFGTLLTWMEENKSFIGKGPSGIAVRSLVEFVRGPRGLGILHALRNRLRPRRPSSAD